MGLIKLIREKYFGKQPKRKQRTKAHLFFENEEKIQVPRAMRRKCKKDLPFTHEQKKLIRVI